MSTKGGESAMLLKFTVWLLDELGGADVFGEALIGAVVSLQAFLDKRREVRGRPDDGTLRYMRIQMDVHIRCCRQAGISLIPKSHLSTHLVDRQLDRTDLRRRSSHPAAPPSQTKRRPRGPQVIAAVGAAVIAAGAAHTLANHL